jgi:putative MATE family efflux protein
VSDGTEAKERPGGLWADIRAGLSGQHRDHTRGRIGRAIVVLAVPMVLEMCMQSLFGVVDVFFVGKLGADAVSVVGITDSLLTLVFAIALGLSMGTTAMVARRIGEGAPERASVAAVQAIAAGTLLSVPVGVLGFVYAGDLLRLMGGDESLVRTGTSFTALMLAGNATIMLLFLINAVFRGAGEPAIAMRALWIANGINIALDPILIFGLGPFPALGLYGAAVATVVGRGIGVVYQLWRLGCGRGRIVVAVPQLRIRPAVMARLLRVSAIGILQFLIGTASFVALVRIVSVFGELALAGYTIAVRVIIFVLLPAWGMGNAAATLVGQNLGAGNPGRAERSVWMTARANMVFLGLIAVLFITLAETLVRPFSSDPEVIGYAADCLRIVSYSYVFWSFGMIAVMAFNGAGDTTTPTWINLFVYWLFQIPLAWLLAVELGFGPNGAFGAIAATQVVLAATGVLLFRRGTWKHRTI